VGRAFRLAPVPGPAVKVGPGAGETRKGSRHGLRVSLGPPEERPPVTDSSQKVLRFLLAMARRQGLISSVSVRPTAHRGRPPNRTARRPTKRNRPVRSPAG